jgi:hypothetical protein
VDTDHSWYILYAISTAPRFAVLVQFPKADSIRRIALGDSNYFLAEADKDDPHYAIVKQIRASGEKPKSAIETNMVFYMASGRVVNIMLKAGKLAETAYSIDYKVADAQAPHDPAPPEVDPEVIERAKRERVRKERTERMVDDVKKSPKKQAGIVAGGLTLHPYRTERLDELALVSFDIENTSAAVDGLSATQAIRKILPTVPIVLNTLYGTTELEVEANKLGIRKVVDKTKSGALISAVEELLSAA